MFLKISQYPKENTCVGVSFQEKPVDLQLYEKETTTQVFFCEYWEIFKNINKKFSGSSVPGQILIKFQLQKKLVIIKNANCWNMVDGITGYVL